MSQTAVVTFRAAKETEYAGFLDLIHQHAADYLEPSLTLLGLDKTEFAHLFRTRGQVVSILADRAVAGFYWIEERDGTLHI
nr:hypothetical protein [candidate division Zixibacteria bacterium]